jgi:hypothetical protein
MQPTQLVYSVLSFKLGSSCLYTELHREKTGQEHHQAVPTLSATLRMARYPVVAGIVHRETENRRS